MLPHIPVDIAIEILAHFALSPDSAQASFLWTSARLVSRAFREAAEHVFLTSYMQEVSLKFKVGEWCVPFPRSAEIDFQR